MKGITTIRQVNYTVDLIESTIKGLEEMLYPVLEMDTLEDDKKKNIGNAVMLLSQYLEDIKDTPIK